MRTLPPNNAGAVVDTYGSAEFSRDAIITFSSLSDALVGDANLLHPQMATLAAAVRQAVENSALELPLQICEFIDRALGHPNAIPEIENAVAISFVEAQELRRAKAGLLLLERMPKRVRSILLEQEQRGGTQ